MSEINILPLLDRCKNKDEYISNDQVAKDEL